MSRMSLLFLLTILLIAPQYVNADDEPDLEDIKSEIFNNISQEVAYFFFSSEAMRRSGDLEISSKYDDFRSAAIERALMTAMVGRNQEMAQNVTHARIELSTKEMSEEIGKDISNISILINKYAIQCISGVGDRLIILPPIPWAKIAV